MSKTVLTIAGRRFFPQEGIDALKQQITDRVRAGGGFITIPTSPGHVDVLITAATPVTFDHHLLEEDDDAPVAAGASSREFVFPDFEEYGL